MGSANPTALFKALDDKLKVDDLIPGALKAAGAMGVVGLLLCALFSLWNPTRLAAAYLQGFCFLLSLTLGALFFVMVQHLTRAGWSVTVRRVAEILASNVLLMALLFIPLVPMIGYGYLQPKATYPSLLKKQEAAAHHGAEAAHGGEAAHGAAAGHGDHGGAHDSAWKTGPHLPGVAHATMDKAKKWWLSFWPLVCRMAIYFFIWISLSRFFLGKSVQQDESKDPAITNSMQRWAPLGVVLFGLTVCLAGFDLLMALDPYWYSTMFGVYFFAGGFLSFFATLNLTLFLLRSKGVAAEAITPEHYHDTGKFMFAFTVFWAYIGFSQYMLIWYGNIPEETGWFLIRQTGGWKWISALLILGHFVVPFFLVMSRWPKRQPALLALLSVYILGMHFLDMFWLVSPQKSPLGVVPVPLMDFFLLIFMIAIYAAFTISVGMRGKNMIPTGDPRLIEAVHFHNQ
ncbi:MAG TPA: hypothetical protein DEA08_27000 [Planctomycetes bacterium]|nr:hypothetical protein [Planctomycetota bacterium]